APHKNLPNLIRAIDGLKCRLMILGRIDDETAAMLKEKAIDFENEFEVGEDRIRELYATADIVAFCSTFEGFGLPIIEAQAMGTPVVTSNIDPMKEVAGDGALLADPHSPEEIRAAIDRLIEDSSLREKLVLAGTDNVKRYEPATIAAKYAELYREVYGNNQL
ncbi:MAG TPA: glycosyltransferase, partial [Pyrinomonadaceae bacterium]|nr:glycosyltransferase [Pyrinomonadaceae bacterium]